MRSVWPLARSVYIVAFMAVLAIGAIGCGGGEKNGTGGAGGTGGTGGAGGTGGTSGTGGSDETADVGGTAGSGGIGGTGGSGGTTVDSGTAGSAGMEVVPLGFEDPLPEPQSCDNRQGECNGYCLDAEHPDGDGCHFLGQTNVTHRLLLNRGVLYYEDYNGVSRMDVTTGVSTSLTTTEAVEIAVAGDMLFFSTLDRGLYFVPIAGGDAVEISTNVYPQYLLGAGNRLIFSDVLAGGLLRSVDVGSTEIIEYSYEAFSAFVEGTTFYFTDSGSGRLHSAPLDNLTMVTESVPLSIGTFAVRSGTVYATQGNDIVRVSLTDGVQQTLWKAGTGDRYNGQVVGPYLFPEAAVLFFVLGSEVFDHVVMLDPVSGVAKRLGSFTPTCVSEIAADANYVYVGDCSGVICLDNLQRPTEGGVYARQRLSLSTVAQADRGKPRSEPDSGKPTVRDRRGARGNVIHAEL